MANVTGTITLNGIVILKTDVAPYLTGGLLAPKGSFASAQDGSGLFYNQSGTAADWYRLVQSNDALAGNILLVKKNPVQGEFATIEAAMAFVSGSTASNPFLILVGVGVFKENLIVCKPYVSIVGSAIETTRVESIGANNLFEIVDIQTEISFMTIQNVPSGKIAVYANDCGNYSQLHKITFDNCDTCVKVISVTKNTVCYLQYVDFNGVFTNGLYVDSVGNAFLATVNAENFYSFPAASGTTGAFITGTKATVDFLTFGIFGGPQPHLIPVVGNIGIHCEDGSIVDIMNGNLAGLDVAFDNPNSGAGVYITITGVDFSQNNTDISVQKSTSALSLIGTADSTKISIHPSAVFTTSFVDVDFTKGVFLTGTINNADNYNNITDVSTLLRNQSIGVISGGSPTDGGGLNVDIATGIGYVFVGGILRKITWGNTFITLGANQSWFVYFNSVGVLSSSNVEPNFYENVIICHVDTNLATIQFIDKINNWSSRVGNRTVKMVRNVFGSLYQTGSTVTENGTAFKIDVQGGVYWFGVDEFAPVGGNAQVFDRYYRKNPFTGWDIEFAQDIIPQFYDDGSGTPVAIPFGKWVKHVIYIVGDGVNEKYLFVYAQQFYNLEIDAINAPLPTPPSSFVKGVTTIASFVVDDSGGNIKDILSERPLPLVQSSTTSPISDHTLLSNLNAGNAGHNQFLMRDGSTNMTGILHMNTQNVDGIGTLNFIAGLGGILQSQVTTGSIKTWTLPNFSGTLVTQDGTQILTNKSIGDKVLNLNANGIALSGDNVGFGIIENAIQTGYFKTNGTRDGWTIRNPAQAFDIGLAFSTLTLARTFTFPNLSGTIATIDGGQTFTSAIWNATAIAAIYGGTGQTVYVVGDMLYASTTTALSRLADVAVGSYLRSGGVGVAPLWSTLVLPNASTIGDILYSSSANTITSLADVATGNAIISGGVGAVPTYGKIGLTTHVSGTLVVANGGTGLATTTVYGVICGGTTATGNFQNAGAGTTGQVFTSNGAAALPSWQDHLHSGTVRFTSNVNIGTAAGPLFYTAEAAVNPTATDSIAVGTRQMISRTGNLSRLYVALTTAPGGATTRTFTVYINGVATALAVTITGAATTGNNVATTVAVNAGDTVSCANTNTGGPAQSDGVIISFISM